MPCVPRRAREGSTAAFSVSCTSVRSPLSASTPVFFDARIEIHAIQLSQSTCNSLCDRAWRRRRLAASSTLRAFITSKTAVVLGIGDSAASDEVRSGSR